MFNLKSRAGERFRGETYTKRYTDKCKESTISRLKTSLLIGAIGLTGSLITLYPGASLLASSSSPSSPPSSSSPIGTAENSDPTALPGLLYQTFPSAGNAPSLPSAAAEPLSSGTVTQINHDWGGGQVLDSGRSDGVLVRYEGWLTAPTTDTYYMCGSSDDGFMLYLDGDLVINDWYDRGGGCGQTADVDFSDGQPKELVAYYYENGGGAHAYLVYYTGDGWTPVPGAWYTQSEPAPPPPPAPENFLGAPQNLTVTSTDEGVLVSWEAATDDTGVSPERYAVSWNDGTSGWGIATGNAGDENALNTSVLLGYSLFETTGGLDVNYTFTVRADNDTASVYSLLSAPAQLLVSAPTPPTTTTTTTLPPPPTPAPENSIFVTANEGWELSAEAPYGVFTEVFFASYGNPEDETLGSCHAANSLEKVAEAFVGKTSGSIAASNEVFGDPCSGTYKRLSVRLVYDGAPPTTTTTTTTTTTEPPATTTPPAPPVIVPDNPPTPDPEPQPEPEPTPEPDPAPEPETPPAEGDSSTDAPSSDVQDPVADDAQPDEQPSTDAGDTPTEDPVSEPETGQEDEGSQDESPVDENTTPEADTVADVEEAISDGVSAEEAIALVTSVQALSVLTGDQAVEVFAALDTSSLDDAQKSEIAEALNEASEEVKAAFESEIDIYGEGFDEYVPIGSTVDVGTRRTLIAVTTTMTAITAGGAAAAAGGSSRSPTPSGDNNGGGNNSARREDEPEEEDEEAGGLEGPEGDDDDTVYTRNSIYHYEEETMKIRGINWLGLIKKFANETAGLAFTLAGSAIMFVTLSGDTRRIAMIATGIALAVHYVHVLLKNDEN